MIRPGSGFAKVSSKSFANASFSANTYYSFNLQTIDEPTDAYYVYIAYPNSSSWRHVDKMWTGGASGDQGIPVGSNRVDGSSVIYTSSLDNSITQSYRLFRSS